MRGFGTERIEDDLAVFFPDARIARMDLDSTSQKNRYIEIINDFEDHKIDILVGTHRMLSKTVKWHDLGLLIIDEEQKFGVSTKEKLRPLVVFVSLFSTTTTCGALLASSCVPDLPPSMMKAPSESNT